MQVIGKKSKALFTKFYSQSYTLESAIEEGTINTGFRGVDAAPLSRHTPKEKAEVSFSTFNKEDMTKCDQTFPMTQRVFTQMERAFALSQRVWHS
jgi:hypothetical protein